MKTITLFVTTMLLACGSGGSNKAANPPVSNAQEYQLSLSIDGGGLGRVYIEELNQYCSVDCTLSLPEKSSLSLVAEPANADFQFLYWSENCAYLDRKKCTLELNRNTNISAFFEDSANTHRLTIHVIGDGTVSIPTLKTECTSECTYYVTSEQVYNLVAKNSSNSTFYGWSNDCRDAEQCPLTVRADTTIEAKFSSQQQSAGVTVNVYGAGSVTINNQPEPCVNSCIYEFDIGSNISITAQQDENKVFLNWSGACEGEEGSCTLVVSDDLTVNAFYQQPPASSDNTFTIKEPLGKTSFNIPIQIARPFVEGEIATYPVVKIAGKSIISQASIKQRHQDGSVKHAIINFVLDQLPANGELVASIENGVPPSGDALTKEEMLSDKFSFDAIQEYSFASGQVNTISARTMLKNNDYSTWLEGPVATTIVLADHSQNRVYDVGSDSYRSVRPMFHVTFWKALNKYTVRYVSENTNTIALQDQSYDLQLLIGQNAQSVYQKSQVPHQARSIWTKKYSTFENPVYNLNHNVRYLVQTKSVPYFDISREISDTAIQAYWNVWQGKNKDLYDSGLWQSAMAVGGGRPDIGLYPSWAVKWLFTGDWRLTEIALTQADLASAWPMHLREGKAGLKFDLNQSIDAQGKIVSIAPGARPTHWTERPDWHEVNDADKIIPITELSRSNWRPDTAHHPDISSLQFLLTGDKFYLDQMLFSAAYVTGNNNAKGFNSRLGRGQTGSEGLLYSGEVRGQAWAIRTRVHTYDILPDDWPEKSYFNTLNENAFAAFQGLFDLQNTYPNKSAIYEHARNIVADSVFVSSGQPSPLGFWNEGVSSPAYVSDDYVDTELVNQAIAPWMQNFVTISLGRAQELGYDTHNLVQYSSRYLNQVLQNPVLPNHMFSAYITPTLNQDNQWFNSVSAIANTYQDGYLELINNRLIMGRDTEHGYYSIGMAAAAYAYDRETPVPWQYIMQNVLHKTIYDNNPKWAILPRVED